MTKPNKRPPKKGFVDYVKSECYICGKYKPLRQLFKCAECFRTCCREHVDDDYLICPECRENE